MLSLNRRKVLFVAFFMFTFFKPCAYIRGQEQATGQSLVRAQRILWLFYPELKDHKYAMTTTTHLSFDLPAGDFGNLDISVGEAAPGTIFGIAGIGKINGVTPPTKVKPGPIYAKQFLTASFTFNRAGQLFTFSCGGPAAGNPEAYNSVRQLVDWHPEWTENQAITALMKAGAAYGPGDRNKFLNILPANKIEESFGTATIISTEFESVREDHSPPYALLHWLVVVKAKDRDGVEQTYRMIFEPFKGKLIQIDAVAP